MSIEVILTKEYIGMPKGMKKRFPAITVKKLLDRHSCKLVNKDDLINYSIQEVRKIIAEKDEEITLLKAELKTYKDREGIAKEPEIEKAIDAPPANKSMAGKDKKTKKNGQPQKKPH